MSTTLTPEQQDLAKQRASLVIAKVAREDTWLGKEIDRHIDKLHDLKAKFAAEIDANPDLRHSKVGAELYQVGLDLKEHGKRLDDASHISVDRDKVVFQITETAQIEAWVEKVKDSALGDARVPDHHHAGKEHRFGEIVKAEETGGIQGAHGEWLQEYRIDPKALYMVAEKGGVGQLRDLEILGFNTGAAATLAMLRDAALDEKNYYHQQVMDRLDAGKSHDVEGELEYTESDDLEAEILSASSDADKQERAERGVISVEDAKDEILGVQHELQHEGKYGDRERAAVTKAFDALNELEEKGVTEFAYDPAKERLSAAIDAAKQKYAKEAEDTKLTLDTHAMVEAEYRDHKRAKELDASPLTMQSHANGIGLTKAEHEAGIAHALESSDLGLTPRDAIIPPPRLDDRHHVAVLDKDAIREEISNAIAAGKTSCVVQGSDLEIRGETMKEAYRQNMKVQTPDAATREELRTAVLSVEKERAAERNAGRSKENDGPNIGM